MRTSQPKTPTGAGDPNFRARVTPASLRTLFRIFERWHAGTAEAQALLGNPPRSTYFAWKGGSGPVLSADGLTRVSYLLGIYEALQRLYSLSRDNADRWVSHPNTDHLFAGQRPLDFMATGGLPALHAVRAYLDNAVGGPPTRDPDVIGSHG